MNMVDLIKGLQHLFYIPWILHRLAAVSSCAPTSKKRH